MLCKQNWPPLCSTSNPRLLHTQYLQDEAAIGHPCLAGDNAGVQPSIRDLCAGDPTPGSRAQGGGGDVTARPPREWCSQHLHLTRLPCRPRCCPQNLQSSIPPASLLPEDVPSREQRDTWGQAQGQPILQPAHAQGRGPPCPAPQGDRRGQDAPDHIRAIGTSLNDGRHWVRGQEGQMRLLGTGGHARCPQPHLPSTLSTCSRASSPAPLRARQV